MLHAVPLTCKLKFYPLTSCKKCIYALHTIYIYHAGAGFGALPDRPSAVSGRELGHFALCLARSQLHEQLEEAAKSVYLYLSIADVYEQKKLLISSYLVY